VRGTASKIESPARPVPKSSRGAVVEAAAEALVDQPVGRAFDAASTSPNGREGGGRQGLGGDAPHGRSAFRRWKAMRSTWVQASANSAFRSFSRRRRKAARIEAFVLSRTAMMKGKPKRAV
jgi:hypothetical protein